MDKTEDIVETYIVFIEDNGYYADKQNGKKINYTENYLYAKRYKTRKSAYHNLIKHIVYDDNLKDKNIYIQPLNVKQIIEFELCDMKEVNIEIKERNEVKITDIPLKVKVETVSIEDEFWN